MAEEEIKPTETTEENANDVNQPQPSEETKGKPKSDSVKLDKSATDDLIKEMAAKPKEGYVSGKKLEEFAEPSFLKNLPNENATFGEQAEEEQGEAQGQSSYDQPTTQKDLFMAAKFTRLTDNIASFSLTAIAKESDSSLFKANQAQLSEIETDMVEVIKMIAPNLVIPPYVWLIMSIGAVYGTKLPMALQLRKANMGNAPYPEGHPMAEKKKVNDEDSPNRKAAFERKRQQEQQEQASKPAEPKQQIEPTEADKPDQPICQNPNCDKPRPADKRKKYCSDKCNKEAREIRKADHG